MVFNNVLPFRSEIYYAEFGSTAFWKDVESWKGISQHPCIILKGMKELDSQLPWKWGLECDNLDTQSVVFFKSAHLCGMSTQDAVESVCSRFPCFPVFALWLREKLCASSLCCCVPLWLNLPRGETRFGYGSVTFITYSSLQKQTECLTAQG